MKKEAITLVFATQNDNKAKEIQSLLPQHIIVKTLKDIGCDVDIPENQPDLKGNALAKANYVVTNFNSNCFADDTGLEIEALNGEPGVYSARYAGPEKNSQKNMDLVLEKLKGETNRRAQFRTVIALILDDETHLFEGIVKGEIRKERAGADGFGYDPIFEPEDCGRTFAEMSMEEKNTMSHRGRALEKMVAFFNS
ncbi:MAG: non-canonical purine NTP pyrophosphatase, RdgB/HAM1 family [Fluviicola sp.]|nr:MAG: non-canonical purine NTP pyrophosphatase, RdgB/HAM1 family [Fluviicola sp.]